MEADTQLGGYRTGVTQTPTIYVVTDSPQTPFVQVTEQEKLFDTIEQVKAALGPAPKKTKAKAKGANTTTAKKATTTTMAQN